MLIILIILFGAYLLYKYCCPNSYSVNTPKQEVEVKTASPQLVKEEADVKTAVNQSAKEEIVVETESDTLAFFNVKDANFELNCEENFAFRTSSYEIEQPIAPELTDAAGKLKSYLTGNPNIGLQIKGYYGASEKNVSLFSNLGLARANAIKGYFITNGFNKKQMAITSEESIDIKEGISVIRGAADYSFFVEEDDTQQKKLEALMLFREQLQKEPLTLYFETGNSQINLSQEERAAIKKIGEYLTAIDNSRLLIIGHSDSTGKSEMNKTLSQKRAESVKAEFVKNGFIASSIETVGEGADMPMYTNETEEGRAKNRRVTVTIK